MLDSIIVGTGPAGIAASIYASRYKIEHKIFGQIEGGLISTSHLVDNYPGIQDISGFELGMKFIEHVKKFNPDGVVMRKIVRVEKKDNHFLATDDRGDTYEAKSVLMAAGTKYRRLGVPGENEYEGKGVTWCATCDAFFYKKKDVVVIGGGDSALEAAHLLTSIANHVYVVHRGPQFRAEPTWVDMVNAAPNAEFIMSNELVSIDGDGSKVTGITLTKPDEKGRTTLDIQGVFIEIGSDPIIDLATDLGVKYDATNYIIVGADQATNVPGVFAAGDFTTGSNKFRQVLTAMGEGIIAANSIYMYLSKGE